MVSGLVLNFIPDQQAALAEMARVSVKGGMIAAYVWDCAGKMELMRFFWDAAVELDPGAAKMDEGIRFALCRREALEKLFAGAGLKGVEVVPIDIPTPFANFAEPSATTVGKASPIPSGSRLIRRSVGRQTEATFYDKSGQRPLPPTHQRAGAT